MFSHTDGRRVVVDAKLKARGSGVVAHLELGGARLQPRCIVVRACTPLRKLVSRISAGAHTLSMRLIHAPGA